MGSVTFIQRFGSELNHHRRFHVCAIDGVFSFDSDGIRYFPASLDAENDLADMEHRIRVRTLRLFKRRGLLDADAIANMLSWMHSGFSLDARVCIKGTDKERRERLLSYCG